MYDISDKLNKIYDNPVVESITQSKNKISLKINGKPE